ncbi:MAG: hypothetical protein V9E96_19705, partial [Chitinophagaceae bacterium]
AKNTIDFAQILHSLDEVPARQKLFLIDACHSGDLDKSGIEKNNKTILPIRILTRQILHQAKVFH